MKLELPKPEIFRELWDYDAWGHITARLPDQVGYSPKQVEEITADYKTLLLAARDVFDQLSKLGNGDCDGNSIGNTIAQEARAKIDRLFE